MAYGILGIIILNYKSIHMMIGINTWMSTSGGAFFLGYSLVAWLSKKQGSISLSTTEAKYIATATCYTQVLRMIQTLADLEVKYSALIPIHCDNTSAISVSENHAFHSKTKHIPIKYQLLREQVTNIVVSCIIFHRKI